MTSSVTERGFVLINFQDLYNKPCSFQESSLAEQEAIWLGCDGPTIYRNNLAMTQKEQEAEGISALGRMHLSREQAGTIGRMLVRYAETGQVEILPDRTVQDSFTASGEPIYLHDIHRTRFKLSDVEDALHNICRYHGSIRVTVAQHTLICVRIAAGIIEDFPSLKPEIAILQVAAHDFSEAYYGDVPSGLRAALGDVLTAITLPIEEWVHGQLRVPYPAGPYRDFVDLVDRLAVYGEMAANDLEDTTKTDLYQKKAVVHADNVLRVMPLLASGGHSSPVERQFVEEVLSLFGGKK
jgi:5'-deoxynucleotidase YfbR-like HD superfamily hydrolase